MKFSPAKLAALAGSVLLPLTASAQINLGGVLNNIVNKTAQGKPATATAAPAAPVAAPAAKSPWAANPSLCEATDYVLFSAVFGKKAPGKVLSLCVDREKNPTRLGYRYGPEGAAEMKFDAPTDGVFYQTEQTLSPRANLKALYFEKNGHTFAITECTGGECPENFKLMVFKGNKLISKQPTKELGSFIGDFPKSLVQDKDTKLDFGL